MPVDLARQMARLAVCAWPGLADRHAILDVIGRLLTNRCQVEKLLFYGYVFSRFGKLPIFGRFVPQIISPIHVAASSTPEDAGGHSRTGLSPLTAIRNPRSPDVFACAGSTRNHTTRASASLTKILIALSLRRMLAGSPASRRCWN